jgi:signal transduction histidine kinase
MELNCSQKELFAEAERLKKENALLKTKQETTLKSVQILVAKISHELKTPLNSIIGFSELMQYKNGDKNLTNYIKNILNSSHYMLSLVQNIIDITKAQNDKLELSYSIFNPDTVIEEIIESFNEKIKYTLVDITLCADYVRFKQLVFNLISNALKFNREGKETEIITYCEKDNFYFEISDNGEGIRKEDYEKIFDFYSQVSDDTNKRQLGAGIGLALCKSIVRAHGGKIEVISEREKGSTFRFNIPIDFNKY